MRPLLRLPSVTIQHTPSQCQPQHIICSYCRVEMTRLRVNVLCTHVWRYAIENK